MLLVLSACCYLLHLPSMKATHASASKARGRRSATLPLSPMQCYGQCQHEDCAIPPLSFRAQHAAGSRDQAQHRTDNRVHCTEGGVRAPLHVAGTPRPQVAALCRDVTAWREHRLVEQHPAESSHENALWWQEHPLLCGPIVHPGRRRAV